MYSPLEDGRELPTAEVPEAPLAAANSEGTAPAADTSEPATWDEAAATVDLAHPLAQEVLLEPTRWRIWPAVAVLRWLQRQASGAQRIVYRSNPSLSFSAAEIQDVAIGADGVEMTLAAPGLAAPGSPLPASDVARILADRDAGGAMAAWLDGPIDLFMHVLEQAQAQNNAAFALATGGDIWAVAVVACLTGRSAALHARADGTLADSMQRRHPEGAVGLAGLYMGTASAAGLEQLFEAYTGLAVEVEEFVGAEVRTMRAAAIGGPTGTVLGAAGSVLGTTCRPPAAGIQIVLDAGDDADALRWARDPVRRDALHLLAQSYIGTPSPVAWLFLDVDAGTAPPAALDGEAAFGGMVVLGRTEGMLRLPLIGSTGDEL